MSLENIKNLNLRYLLWRESEGDHRHWTFILENWLKCNSIRAEQILNNERQLSGNDIQQLGRAVSSRFDEGEFVSRSYLELDKVDILKENMQFLLGELKYGEAKTLAVYLNISDDTVSEWKRWRRKGGIEKRHLAGIVRYFGIEQNINLLRDPIFLWMNAVGTEQRREWLYEHIKRLPKDKLNKLFPALEILLK